MKRHNRPDLSNRTIIIVVCLPLLAALVLLIGFDLPAPGSTSGQIAGAIGALLLLAPMTFSLLKRSQSTSSPPAWFIVHVLFSVLGCCFIIVHIATADWISPPGFVLLLLFTLILQGGLLRSVVSAGFSLQFAHSASAGGFQPTDNLDKAALSALIERKRSLLLTLSPSADEGLFSPTLRHWCLQPWRSFQYQRMAETEARMIGVRQAAGLKLGWSRRLHMLLGLVFYLGLISHVIVVLFFAGYAADGGTVDWWYITRWGS